MIYAHKVLSTSKVKASAERSNSTSSGEGCSLTPAAAAAAAVSATAAAQVEGRRVLTALRRMDGTNVHPVRIQSIRRKKGGHTWLRLGHRPAATPLPALLPRPPLGRRQLPAPCPGLLLAAQVRRLVSAGITADPAARRGDRHSAHCG